ncbi:VOC family protein [Nocardioides sp. CER19]|uniref:VOC family protein n=1 Tax=Nocardioides sp. CER19 TaxID=3038538 RepID=UPI00244CE50C|nr:VOC family protein [Nocardioides sp. CER19]MDH2412656.1 VOC family protein [Nocardioides sp. CER19]
MNQHATPTTIALPTTGRRAAYAFFRDGLGLPTPGDPAEDGVPEPLRVVLNSDTEVMLIPADGFAFVTGREATSDGRAECMISLPTESPAEVDARFARAVGGGGTAVAPPAMTPWGSFYRALVADPDGHLWQLMCLDAGGQASAGSEEDA